MTVREMMAKGDFSYMSQVQQPDGSVLVTLRKRGDSHVYKMWVRDLCRVTEQVIKEEVS